MELILKILTGKNGGRVTSTSPARLTCEVNII